MQGFCVWPWQLAQSLANSSMIQIKADSGTWALKSATACVRGRQLEAVETPGPLRLQEALHAALHFV